MIPCNSNSLQKIEKTNPVLKSILLLTLIFSTISVHGQGSGQTITIHDGITLKGWKSLPETNQSLWEVKDGVITGGDGITNIRENAYLYTENEYGDFEFRCLFRLSGDFKTGMINSGIQYRSKIKDGHMVGYQADIGNGYWGDIYDEHRRGKLVGGDLSTLKHLLKADG